ncbi:hypothetical protein GCM10010341_09900 [Streptomyces noursei]|nr:hypothetical protein GCM10010341_09900 [Streptomyces noursei]
MPGRLYLEYVPRPRPVPAGAPGGLPAAPPPGEIHSDGWAGDGPDTTRTRRSDTEASPLGGPGKPRRAPRSPSTYGSGPAPHDGGTGPEAHTAARAATAT